MRDDVDSDVGSDVDGAGGGEEQAEKVGIKKFRSRECRKTEARLVPAEQE